MTKKKRSEAKRQDNDDDDDDVFMYVYEGIKDQMRFIHLNASFSNQNHRNVLLNVSLNQNHKIDVSG